MLRGLTEILGGFGAYICTSIFSSALGEGEFWYSDY
jgi:hypothetical protein